MSSIGSSLTSGSTSAIKNVIKNRPTDAIKSATTAFKKPTSNAAMKTQLSTMLGDPGLLAGGARHSEKMREVRQEKEAIARGENERKAAEEQAAIDAEKIASEKAQLDKVREQRRKVAAKKGRRASVVSSPLGDTGEASTRRATLGG